MIKATFQSYNRPQLFIIYFCCFCTPNILFRLSWEKLSCNFLVIPESVYARFMIASKNVLENVPSIFWDHLCYFFFYSLEDFTMKVTRPRVFSFNYDFIIFNRYRIMHIFLESCIYQGIFILCHCQINYHSGS